MIDIATSRREFLCAAAGAALTPSLLEASRVTEPVKRLKKAVKYRMIREGETIEEKFRILKETGYDGLEMYSPDPDIDRDEVLAAMEKTGMVVHGVVNAGQWQIRHSDPDPEVRAEALERLETALNDCAYYGGDTVLLVPGRVDPEEDGDFDTVWERSTENIAKAIPAAEEAGVIIAIEVVWNDFLTTPEQFIEYVDQFESPWVQAYFDISNMIRYGVPPAEWIRQLGDRMVKFDFKGYSHEDQWVDIGEGDEDWPEVRRALEEVGYWGWATAEVRGGDREELRRISRLMNKHVLGL